MQLHNLLTDLVLFVASSEITAWSECSDNSGAIYLLQGGVSRPVFSLPVWKSKWQMLAGPCAVFVGTLVDPASSHMLVSKIKPCMRQHNV